MWILQLKTGLEVYESEMHFWDNVPKDVEIKSLVFAIGRPDSTPYILFMDGYESYCIERTGISVPGGKNAVIGYCLLGLKNGQIFEIEVGPEGMQFKSYKKHETSLPERCWRKGLCSMSSI